jgi:tRNA(Ile)-lysidine synthase
MRRFSPADLLGFLDSSLPPQASGELCVAYSGGLDSTVLLHAAVLACSHDPRYRVRAVHVDHRLQPASAQWAAHCAQVAETLGIELTRLLVEVVDDHGVGMEAAAREARYRALRVVLRPGEVALTAHHADDQLETVLLALMRGAGVRGMGAIEALQSFGSGNWLARPLLELTRVELEAWARATNLTWISDPSNDSVDFDRNYLRHRVVPAMYERWPAAARSAVRTAGHIAEAGRVLEALAEADSAHVVRGPCLDVESLKALGSARLRNVLRQWLRQSGLSAPSTRKLAAMEHDLLNARADRVPCVDWPDAEVRRHRGLLYCLPRQPQLKGTEILIWPTAESIELPAQLGSLSLRADASGEICAARLADSLSVRFRAGGEIVQPCGDPHHRKLKKLLQSAAVLPWWRDRLPLVYSADRLVAVGDLWVDEEFAPRERGESAVRIEWHGRPQVFARKSSAPA